MAILDGFGPVGSASLAELHARTGMPKPTLHRQLSQMVGLGLVERSEGHGYRLGLKLFELGQLVPEERRFRESLGPVLKALHAETGLIVHLAVLAGADVVYVQKLEPDRGPQVASRVGGRMPSHCTAVGKALLAHAPADVTRAVVSRGLPRHARGTIVAPNMLLRQLDDIRRRGYARDLEESAAGIACLAAPVVGQEGRPVAAISVTGWTHGLHPERTLHALRAAASSAQRRLDRARPERRMVAR
ncbi:IclR family transcriptional regulator [Pseudonocardia kujensis]|nr:IclR family transcriptional regulator [Pseudonocardia kujensis]